MSQLSHAQFPLRRHPDLLVDHRRARSAAVAEPRGANGESRDRLRWPASFRNGGRNQIGTVADIKSESLAGLPRNSHAFDLSPAQTSSLKREFFLVSPRLAAAGITHAWAGPVDRSVVGLPAFGCLIITYRRNRATGSNSIALATRRIRRRRYAVPRCQSASKIGSDSLLMKSRRRFGS